MRLSRFFNLFILVIINLQACAMTNDPVKIGVVSDLHYLAQSLMDSGEAIRNYEKSTARETIFVSGFIDHVLNEYKKENIDILFIPGDLTKDGERESHLELAEKFKELQEKGIRVYVIPGNHDINMPYAKGYKENSTYKAENISPLDFEEIYKNFGYAEAIYRDNNSLSYVVELTGNTWLVSIDVSRYKEYTEQSISGGRIDKATEIWLQNIFDEAKKQNKTLIGMMHHSLVEHFPYHQMLFPQYIIEDWKHFAEWFADNNMKAIFTGHFHANDITEYKSSNQNSIFDIETGALSGYAFPYRIVTYDGSGMDIETRNLLPLLTSEKIENNKQTLKRIAHDQALSKIKSFGFDIDPQIAEKIADIAGDILLLHFAGDEVVTDDLKNQLKQLGALLDQNANEDIDFELDFYPPDNNIRIDFKNE